MAREHFLHGKGRVIARREILSWRKGTGNYGGNAFSCWEGMEGNYRRGKKKKKKKLDGTGWKFTAGANLLTGSREGMVILREGMAIYTFLTGKVWQGKTFS